MKRPTAEHRAPRVVRTPKPAPRVERSSGSFDSEAARAAWRQVARTRGSTSFPQERARGLAWGWFVLLGIGLISFVVVERVRKRNPDPGVATRSEAPAETDRAEAPPPPPPPAPEGLYAPGYPTPPPAPTPVVADAGPEPTPTLPRGIGVISTAPSDADADVENEEPGELETTPAPLPTPRPRPSQPRVSPRPPDEYITPTPALPWQRRTAPAGTAEDYAKAYKKIPKARDDRPPVGGIATDGLHIDRVNMGTTYARGRCGGETRSFRVRDHDYANICFRVVHLRETDKVVVYWEHNGELVRRVFVPIPPAHAYRTRAGLRLRPDYRGNWQVRIVSMDGVELATQMFRVD